MGIIDIDMQRAVTTSGAELTPTRCTLGSGVPSAQVTASLVLTPGRRT